jgi:hypothetical protein
MLDYLGIAETGLAGPVSERNQEDTCNFNPKKESARIVTPNSRLFAVISYSALTNADWILGARKTPTPRRFPRLNTVSRLSKRNSG